MQHKSKKILFWIIASILLTSVCVVFGIMTVKLTMKNDLIIQYCFKDNNDIKLIAVYSQWNSGEDGIWHEAYIVKYFDMKTQEEISELKIPRYDAYKIPTYPKLYFGSKQNIWLIAEHEFIQDDTGFIAHFEIKDEKLQLREHKIINNFIPNGNIDNYRVKLLNKYNETFCFDTKLQKLFQGECQVNSVLDTNTTTFFMVSNSAGSTRYSIYYYQTDKPDPMEIKVGTDNQKSVMYYLWFSNNTMNNKDLEYYKNNLKTNEKLVRINTQNFIISPSRIYRSKYEAVFVENDIYANKTIYYCFNNEGNVVWKIDDTTLYLENNANVDCELIDNLYFFKTNKWIIVVNKKTGKIEYKFVF